MFDNFLKKLASSLGVAVLLIGVLISWDQISAPFALASDVQRNVNIQAQNNVAQAKQNQVVTDLLSKLITLQINSAIQDDKTRVNAENRRDMDRVNNEIRLLERKYYGTKTMSDQVKRIYQRLLDEKKDINKRLYK